METCAGVELVQGLDVEEAWMAGWVPVSVSARPTPARRDGPFHQRYGLRLRCTGPAAVDRTSGAPSPAPK